MKRILLVGILASLLSGCWLMYDTRQTPHYPAKVTTVADNVCILVEPKGDEQLASLSIGEVGNEKNRLEKYNLGIAVSNDKCLPLFGYDFEVGHSYGISAVLESPEKKKNGIAPAARIYGVDFSLLQKNGKLEAKETY